MKVTLKIMFVTMVVLQMVSAVCAEEIMTKEQLKQWIDKLPPDRKAAVNQLTEEEKEKWRQGDPAVALKLQTIIDQEYGKKLIVPIDFFGKVVDQFNQPVAGAEITFHISGYPEKKTLKTDDAGLFKIEKKKGSFLFIDQVAREGYEFKRMENPHIFQYSRAEGTVEKLHFADPVNPVVFNVRKRGPVEYVVKSEFGARFYLNEEARPSNYPKPPYKVRILKDWMDSDGIQRGYNGRGGFINPESFEVQCQFDKDKAAFDISFRYLGTDGGLILTEKPIYEAPEQGYLPEVHIQGTYKSDPNSNSQNYNRYLYIRDTLPDGILFARIELEFERRSQWNDGTGWRDGVSIDLKGLIYTNPAGGRSMEFEPVFNHNTEKHRRDIKDRRRKEKLAAGEEKREFDEQAFIQKIREEEKQEQSKKK